MKPCPACGAPCAPSATSCSTCGQTFLFTIAIGPFPDPTRSEAHARVLVGLDIELFSRDPQVLAHHLRRGRLRLARIDLTDLPRVRAALDAGGVPHAVEGAGTETRPPPPAMPRRMAPSAVPEVLRHERAQGLRLSPSIVLALIAGVGVIVYYTLRFTQDADPVRRTPAARAAPIPVKPSPATTRVEPRPAPARIEPATHFEFARPTEASGMAVAVGQRPAVLLTLRETIRAPKLGQIVYARAAGTDGPACPFAIDRLDTKHGFVRLSAKTPAACPMRGVPLSSVLGYRPGFPVWGPPNARPFPGELAEGKILEKAKRGGDTLLVEIELAVDERNRGGAVLRRQGGLVGLLTDRPPGNEAVGFFVAIEHASLDDPFLPKNQNRTVNRVFVDDILRRAPKIDRTRAMRPRADRGTVTVLEAYYSEDGIYVKLRVEQSIAAKLPVARWAVWSRAGQRPANCERMLVKEDVTRGRRIVVDQCITRPMNANRGLTFLQESMHTQPFDVTREAPESIQQKLRAHYGPGVSGRR